MKTRKWWTSLLLTIAALGAGAAPAEGETIDEELSVEIAFHQRQRQAIRRLLGESRWQRLRDARFDYELHEHLMGPQLADLPQKHEEVTDSMVHCLAKVWRESLERRLRLEDRRDGFRSRLAARRLGRADKPARGLDVSPRVRVGSHSSLGLRFQMRGKRSPLLSNLAIQLEHDVGGPDLNLKLSYQSVRADAFVSLHAEHRTLGRTAAAGFRFSF